MVGVTYAACAVAMTANIKKRTPLTFATKLEVIRHVENGAKKTIIAEAFSEDSMCIGDFVGGNTTGTTAELMDAEIIAEVTGEQPNEEAAEHDPTSTDLTPLLTSSEAVAALALVCRYCSAIEGAGLALRDYGEEAVVWHAVANKKQAMLLEFLNLNESIVCLTLEVSIPSSVSDLFMNLHRTVTHLLRRFSLC